MLTYKSNRNIDIFVLSLWFFFVLFLPPFIKTNLRMVVTVFNILWIAFQWIKYKNRIFKLINIRLLFGFIPFVLYFFLSYYLKIVFSYYSSLVLQEFISLLLILIHTLVTCLFLCVFCETNNLLYDDVIKALSLSGVLQLIFVLLSFFNSTIKDKLVSIMIRNASSEIMANALKTARYMRVYGFANNMFDAFGYTVSIIVVLLFAYGIYYKKFKYLFLSIIFIVMPLLNARTGVLLSALGIMLICIQSFKFRNIYKYILGLFVSVFILILLYNKLPSNSIQLLNIGYEQTVLLFSGKVTGVYSEILSNDLVFPDNIFWGCGYAPEAINVLGIDNGYIQLLWRVGLIGIILLILGYTYSYFSIKRKGCSKLGLTSLFIPFFLFFIFMVKIYSLGNTGINGLVFSLIFILNYYSQSNDDFFSKKVCVNE